MPAPSSIPRFTAALKAALEQMPALVGVVISDGLPARGDAMADEWLVLGDVTGVKDIHALNRTTQPRDELLSMEVLVSVVRREMSSQVEANERAFALMAAVEELLQGDPSLQADGVNPWFVQTAAVQLVAATVTGDVSHTKRVEGEDREAAVTFHVVWKARLRGGV